MYCTKCGSKNEDNTAFCTSCGNPLEESIPAEQPSTQAPAYPVPVANQVVAPVYGTQRSVPRCTACGYIGQWKIDPLFRPIDLILGIVPSITVIGLAWGIPYLVTTAIVRSNKDRRDKTCPQCNAKNMWTFVY